MRACWHRRAREAAKCGGDACVAFPEIARCDLGPFRRLRPIGLRGQRRCVCTSCVGAWFDQSMMGTSLPFYREDPQDGRAEVSCPAFKRATTTLSSFNPHTPLTESAESARVQSWHASLLRVPLVSRPPRCQAHQNTEPSYLTHTRSPCTFNPCSFAILSPSPRPLNHLQ